MSTTFVEGITLVHPLCILTFILAMCWAGSCLSATLGITRDRNKIIELMDQL